MYLSKNFSNIKIKCNLFLSNYIYILKYIKKNNFKFIKNIYIFYDK